MYTATVTRKPQKIIFKVLDEGRRFDYKNLPDPTKDENLYRVHGRSLYLIRQLMKPIAKAPSFKNINLREVT